MSYKRQRQRKGQMQEKPSQARPKIKPKAKCQVDTKPSQKRQDNVQQARHNTKTKQANPKKTSFQTMTFHWSKKKRQKQISSKTNFGLSCYLYQV
jgi:hypothetical protein